MIFQKHYIIISILVLFSTNLILGQNINELKIKIDSLYNQENYNKIIDLKNHITALKTNKEKAYLLNKLGKSYKNINKEDSAFHFYKKALDIYTSFNMNEEIALTNYNIYYVLSSQNNPPVKSQPYLSALKTHAQHSKSNKWNAIVSHQLGISYCSYETRDSSNYYLKQSLNQYIKIDSTKMVSQLYSDLGILNSSIYKNQDSALYFYRKAFKILENDSIENKDLNAKFNLYLNTGYAYLEKKDYKKALEYFFTADSIKISKLNLTSKKILYGNMDASYYYMKDFENAYKYFNKYDSIKDKIDLAKQNSSIAETEEKYNNEKLRADALELESKRKTNLNLLIASLALLLFGGITAFLINKNLKKRQLLTEQDKELQIQKVATLLKEQELTAIDAMIEGQEKERQIIANDLHDDLGGLMATVKLHFGALQKKQSPELFKKTNNLLDEAYEKIRGIAHAKNSGVLASQGLLKAIKNMANKISDTNNLHIEIIDHGLESRLENSLELTIFRIIQELITNTIKHAEATEMTIQITNHDHKLNIVVEDNGKGFDIKKLSKTSGIGINSIDKRIENLDGNVHIDSKTGKGTSVIIDIPI
nr:sensor histidine kinase [uncultured Psychroserpens sp.]